jgi:hypothetical protein
LPTRTIQTFNAVYKNEYKISILDGVQTWLFYPRLIARKNEKNHKIAVSSYYDTQRCTNQNQGKKHNPWEKEHLMLHTASHPDDTPLVFPARNIPLFFLPPALDDSQRLHDVVSFSLFPYIPLSFVRVFTMETRV